MSTDRWQQIKLIFDGATKLASPERAAFLDKHCGDDAELRDEVESLLASFDGAAGFMDAPAVGAIADVVAPPQSSLTPGQALGHYEVIRAIGAGGMGEIYLAHDARLDRQVALKLLPFQFTRDPDRARRFNQEARAASALNHPNIITIYEIGELDDHQLFIATEYIEGQTLRQAEGAAIDLLDVLEITIQITSALAAAHAAGIVHRDIKPENVMLRPDGVVKVLDFGLAKLSEPPPRTLNSQAETATYHATAPGLVMGTVNYMSPEQARGLEVDQRTDLFSCGVLLYELLAGRAPFATATYADTIAAILQQEPKPLNDTVPDLPAELQRIVGKLLHKDRDDRYQTAKDLLLDLKELRNEVQLREKLDRVHGTDPKNRAASQTAAALPVRTTGKRNEESEPTVPPTTAVIAPAAHDRTNRRWLLIGSAALFILLTVVGGVWLWRARQSRFRPVKVERIVQVTSWPGLDDYAAISPDGKSVAYSSDHGGNFEIFVKALTPGAKELQLTSDGKHNSQPSWSPDGQYIAYYSRGIGGIWSIPSGGGQAKQLTEFGSSPAWSPDGTTIAFQSSSMTDLGAGAVNVMPPSTLWLVPAGGGELKRITRLGEPYGGHGSPAWSPDGKRLAFTAGNYSFFSTWSTAIDGSNLQQIAEDSYGAGYSADGKSAFFITEAKVMQVAVDPVTGLRSGNPATVEGIGGLPAFVRRLSFSADGKRLVYSKPARSESLAAVKMHPDTAQADGDPVLLFRNTSNRTHMPAYSPDGKKIVFANGLMNGTRCDLWQVNSDGSDPLQLTSDPASELVPSWLPDSSEVAYISDRLGHGALWAINLSTRREHMLLDVKTDVAFGRLSPDGKELAYNLTKDGVINIWSADLASGKPKQLTFDQEMMGFPVWSPDSRSIAFQRLRGDDSNVMVMSATGTDVTQLTFEKGQSWPHGWSADGDKVLYAGFRDGLWNVWWVSRTTKKVQRLTNYTKPNAFVRYPSWSPNGDQVVYEYTETTGNIWLAEIE